MIITSVEPTKDQKMMRIYIDNQYAFSIPYKDYVNNNLYEEQEISSEKLEYIRQTILVQAARQRAVRYLLLRDRSEGEVMKKLLDTGFDPDVANSATQALKTIGYIDDNRYARKYLQERIRLKALSKRSLQYELERKDISSQIIDEVMSDFEINDDEVAFRAAKKKFGKYDLTDRKLQQKVFRFLCHRGFSMEIGRNVIKNLINDKQIMG